MGEYNGVIGGVSAIVTDGFKPWWAGYEGTIEADLVDEGLTIDAAYKRALDWKVVLKDVIIPTGKISVEDLQVRAIEVQEAILRGDLEVAREMAMDIQFSLDEFKKFEGKAATVREDLALPLGITSDGFGVTQNEALKELLEAMKTYGDVLCKSAGALFDSKQTWMLAKLGEDKHFDGLDETVQAYLLAATGHDGTMALSVRPTNVRVECMNTFAWALKGTQQIITLKHTKNVEDRLGEARKVIENAYNYNAQLDAEIEALLQQEFSRTEYQDRLVPVLTGAKPDEEGRGLTMWERKRDGLVSAYERDDQRNIQGTAWGAVMAVNSYEQWGTQVRGQTRQEMQARKALKGDFPMTATAKEFVLA